MTPLFSPWPENKNIKAAYFGRQATPEDIENWIGKKIPFATFKQIHSSRVLKVEQLPWSVADGDAMVTTLPEIAIRVVSADCLSLLAWSDGVIGGCHAGWRGFSDGIIENWIETLASAGAQKSNLRISIGPAIEKCHFEVGQDVSQKILKDIPQKHLNQFKLDHPDPQKDYIDLKGLAQFKLEALGVKKERILTSDKCTYCESPDLPSYRRDGPKAGRLQAVIVKSAH